MEPFSTVGRSVLSSVSCEGGNYSYRNVDIKLIHVCLKDGTLGYHSWKKLPEVVLKTLNPSSIKESELCHVAELLSILSFNHVNIFIYLVLNCCRVKESIPLLSYSFYSSHFTNAELGLFYLRGEMYF